MVDVWKLILKFFDVPLVMAAIRHVTGTAVVVLLFRLAAYVVKQTVQDQATRGTIDTIENMVLEAIVGLLGILLVILVAKGVYKEGRSGWNDTHFLAI